MADLEKKPAIPLKLLCDTYKIIIPKEVEKKIQFLLNRVYNIEWSGVLFYTYEGSFEKDNLTIICKDILLMDIGGAVSTEFDMSPDVIAYMTENRELLDCQMGLVHSHHSLQTFFSSTDTNTLLVEGKDRNNFVSLIVNNEGTYNAAITRRVKVSRNITEKADYNFFDTEVMGEYKNYSEVGEEVQYFFLKVIREEESPIMRELSNRIDEIRKIKKNKEGINIYSNKIPEYRGDAPKTFSKKPSLFDEGDDNLNKSKVPTEHFDDKIINSIVTQIVTGSVTINEDKINYKTVNMESLYKRRFGSSKSIEFDAFAENFIEVLIYYTEDNRICLKYNKEKITAILATDILDRLEELKYNEFLEVFEEKLYRWTII